MDFLQALILMVTLAFIAGGVGMLWNEAGHESSSRRARVKTFFNYFFE
jgi:hypothetical protein